MMGLSQQKLAELAGVKQSVISDIERGHIKSPRLETAIALAKALNCKLDDLIKGGD